MSIFLAHLEPASLHVSIHQALSSHIFVFHLQTLMVLLSYTNHIQFTYLYYLSSTYPLSFLSGTPYLPTIFSISQCGFRSDRECVDQISAVSQVGKKYLAKGKIGYWAFVDLAKAYDEVDRDALCKGLRKLC